MGKNELSGRENWQNESGIKAVSLENIFYLSFENEFKKTCNKDFRIRKKPKEFKNIYRNILLSKEIEEKIYHPDRDYTHGISIDFAIDNMAKKKTLYIEIKRQEGWIDGLHSSAGRGNAHERSCKFFTPGLLNILRKKGKINIKHLPFWIVFGGNITRDPKRVREITCWFEKHQDHFFMWRNLNDSKLLIQHFNNKLKPILL